MNKQDAVCSNHTLEWCAARAIRITTPSSFLAQNILEMSAARSLMIFFENSSDD